MKVEDVPEISQLSMPEKILFKIFVAVKLLSMSLNKISF
jgi:hypothetical protein